MNRIILIAMVLFVGMSNGHSQNELNNYKYVIVPEQYAFFDEADKYQLNSLTKFLFNKYGFEAFMESDSYPQDLKDDNCLGLRANVIRHKGLMKTKLGLELRDCSNELVFKTKVGETREKEFKKSFNLALRDAFTSFEGIDHAYSGKSDSMKTTNTKEIKEVVPLVAAEEEPDPEVTQQVRNTGESETRSQVEENVSIEPEKGAIKSNNRFPSYKRGGNTFYLKPGYGGTHMVSEDGESVFVLKLSVKDNVFLMKKGLFTGVAVYNEGWDTYTLQYYNASDELQTEIYRSAQ